MRNRLNDLHLYLEVVLRSCQRLRHIRHWISRNRWEIDARFQRTTNRKWPMGYRIRCPQVKLVTTIRLEPSWRCYLATIANYYIVSCEAVRWAILESLQDNRYLHIGLLLDLFWFITNMPIDLASNIMWSSVPVYSTCLQPYQPPTFIAQITATVVWFHSSFARFQQELYVQASCNIKHSAESSS